MVLKGASEMPEQSPKTDAHDRGRFSARRKTEAVLRLLRGEDLEALSRELGVTAATLSGWRGGFLRRRHGGDEEPPGRRPG
jgi:transposase-like protein